MPEAALGEPEAVAELGERRLRQRRRGGRRCSSSPSSSECGKRGMPAMQPSRRMHADAPEAAGVVRHVRVDRVEDAGDDVVRRARARLVQAAGVVVRVVAQVDRRSCRASASIVTVTSQRDAVGHARVRVVRRAADERRRRAARWIASAIRCSL